MDCEIIDTVENNDLVGKREYARCYDKIISERIQENRDNSSSVLKEAEDNFRTTIKGHITHYKYLEDQAIKRGDMTSVAYYKIRRQVYQQILNNFSLANSYNTT